MRLSARQVLAAKLPPNSPYPRKLNTKNGAAWSVQVLAALMGFESAIRLSTSPADHQRFGCGVALFFTVTLDRPEMARHLTFVREPRRVPIVMSPEEVARFLEAASSCGESIA